MLSTLAITSTLALLTSTTLASSISLGSGSGLVAGNWAWSGGVNPCEDSDGRIQLTHGDANPCGIHFTLGGSPDWHFEGCGGPISLFQGDTFRAVCANQQVSIGCGLFQDGFTQAFGCEI
jgi:hypothetical protein